MDKPESLDISSVPGIREAARSIFEMARKRGWGHVTLRFQDGEIRQVDTLVTVKLEESSARRAA